VLHRARHLRAIERLLTSSRVVALLGARQVGKTTLARRIAAARGPLASYFDLEWSADLARLRDPALSLEGLRGLVVLDEVHRRPDLFPTLRVLADRPRGARFLVLGSASPELLRQASESLAGRIAFYELPPFTLDEVPVSRIQDLWLRGGMPRSFTAPSLAESRRWRADFIATFLERDLPQLGIRVPAPTLRRFWSMIAHVHGGLVNLSELGRSMGVSDMTVRHYLDLLAHTYVVRILPPWHENLSKRQVKAPKAYVRDSGLLHELLDVADARHLHGHPKVGASWEGFCIEVLLQRLGVAGERAFFWATHTGAEIDLLVVHGARRLGFEVKHTSSPELTRSMHTALADLRLDRLDVIYPGGETFQLAPRVRAVALRRLWKDVPRLGG
jgi:predicted AAA+ superfamily ATPase